MKRIIGIFLILCLMFLSACDNNELPESEIVQEPIATPQAQSDDYEPEEPPLGATTSEECPLKTITVEGTLPSGVDFADLERLVNEFYRENEQSMAGFSVAVFVGDYVVLDNYYGFIGGATPDFEARNFPDAVFDWGSITKTLIWVSAMQLYERGLLDMNADIREYLPEGIISLHEDSDPVTMLHLMNHTSGLSMSDDASHIVHTIIGGRMDFDDHIIGQTMWTDETADDFNLGAMLMSLELSQPWFRTGEVWHYNNIAAALAGYIVENISGMPFYEYVNTNIFEPLDMTHTATAPGLSDNQFVREQWERQQLRFSRFSLEPTTMTLIDAVLVEPRWFEHAFSTYPAFWHNFRLAKIRAGTYA